MYTLKNVGASTNPCGMPFLIVLVSLRSPPSSTVKLLGPVKDFSNFIVFLHLIILISLSIGPLCHTVSWAADRSKRCLFKSFFKASLNERS